MVIKTAGQWFASPMEITAPKEGLLCGSGFRRFGF